MPKTTLVPMRYRQRRSSGLQKPPDASAVEAPCASKLNQLRRPLRADVPAAVCTGTDRHHAGWAAGLFRACVCRTAQAAWRCLHQAGQDDHCASHLPDHRQWRGRHDPARFGRPRVRQGHGLLPVLLHAGPGDRHAGGARSAAGRGHEHQSGRTGHDRGRRLRAEGARADPDRLRAGHHPQYDGGRLRVGQYPAGVVHRSAGRHCAGAGRRSRKNRC
jgi:hypothetical protein